MRTEMLLDAGDYDVREKVAEASLFHSPATAAAELQDVIERSVIPRLHQALRDKLQARRPLVPVRAPDGSLDGDVDNVADRLLHDDIDSVCTRIEAIRACGRPLERVYLDLLMPAAVRLSELHAEDLCGSAEATIAFCNLQIILRRYASEFVAEAEQPCNGLRALLASPPSAGDGAGLQVFGLVIAAEFFRRAGWEAWTERSLTSTAFQDAVLTQWYDLVEVLATSDDDLDDIASGIKLIRRRAPNRRVGIVACGRVFSERPEFVRLVGADHSASDPLSSLAQAAQLVACQTQRRRLS